MFLRVIDKFFYQLRQMLSVIIFILIGFSCLFFIYWLVFNAKVQMPDFINNFVWAIIDFFAMSIKTKPMYKELIPVLPIIACGIFILMTYIANCIMVILENNHRFFQNCIDTYKDNLAKTINTELHNDFINELKRTSYMLVKISVSVIHHTSYLTAMTDKDYNPEAVENLLKKQIFDSVNSNLIKNKGINNGSVFFLLTDFANSKDFLSELVSKSSTLIKKQIQPKVDINFYCAVDLFNDFSEFDDKLNYLDKVINLKIDNKIAATPRTKVYFENIFPSEYYFEVMGEYNLSSDPSRANNVMIYALKRKY